MAPIVYAVTVSDIDSGIANSEYDRASARRQWWCTAGRGRRTTARDDAEMRREQLRR